MDKQKLKERQETILELVRDFCAQKLDEDYFYLAEKMVLKLGRKRSQPLAAGKPEVWAAGIIHALGTINFLFDKSTEPYTTVGDINEFFGTKSSTTGNKSKDIRDMLKLHYWDPEFSTQRMGESSPFNNLVMVDGLIVPINMLPEPYQEMVKQARAEGRDISFSSK